MSRMGRLQAGSARVVVRRRRATPTARPRSGSWKIAYADYMTAMMAFFLVMWLLSLIPQEDLKTIAEYFRMPLTDAVRGTGSANAPGETLIPSGSPAPDSGATLIPNVSPALIPHPVPARGDVFSLNDARNAGQLEELKSDLDNLIESDPALEEYRPQLLLDMTPDGLRVQILDREQKPMFALGLAQIQPDLSVVLRALAPVLNKFPNKITLAGHTDATQYARGERHYSNWELSADRANAARRELVAGGLDEDKVKQVLGLSSTVSLIKDDPDAAVNRRISIVVLNQRAERRLDEQSRAGESAAQLDDILRLEAADSSAPEWTGFIDEPAPQP